MYFDNISDSSEISATDLNYKQLNRFVTPKSCYIQVDNLQTNGDFINPDIVDSQNFTLVL